MPEDTKHMKTRIFNNIVDKRNPESRKLAAEMNEQYATSNRNARKRFEESKRYIQEKYKNDEDEEDAFFLIPTKECEQTEPMPDEYYEETLEHPKNFPTWKLITFYGDDPPKGHPDHDRSIEEEQKKHNIRLVDRLLESKKHQVDRRRKSKEFQVHDQELEKQPQIANKPLEVVKEIREKAQKI